MYASHEIGGVGKCDSELEVHELFSVYITFNLEPKSKTLIPFPPINDFIKKITLEDPGSPIVA
jgi:hypothetical protein